MQIGYGMCGGAFDVDAKGKYEITITLMDYAGNESEPKTLTYTPESLPTKTEDCKCN